MRKTKSGLCSWTESPNVSNRDCLSFIPFRFNLSNDEAQSGPTPGLGLIHHHRESYAFGQRLAAVAVMMAVPAMPVRVSNSDHHLCIRCRNQRHEKHKSEETKHNCLHKRGMPFGGLELWPHITQLPSPPHAPPRAPRFSPPSGDTIDLTHGLSSPSPQVPPAALL